MRSLSLASRVHIPAHAYVHADHQQIFAWSLPTHPSITCAPAGRGSRAHRFPFLSTRGQPRITLTCLPRPRRKTFQAGQEAGPAAGAIARLLDLQDGGSSQPALPGQDRIERVGGMVRSRSRSSRI